jgi:hypothetical protein
MTQPQTITTAQLEQMQTSITTGGLDAAEQVYSTLYDQNIEESVSLIQVNQFAGLFIMPCTNKELTPFSSLYDQGI